MSTHAEPSGAAAGSALEQRVGRLEDQVGALIEADEERAARRAHELLLLVKAARQDTPGR